MKYNEIPSSAACLYVIHQNYLPFKRYFLEIVARHTLPFLALVYSNTIIYNWKKVLSYRCDRYVLMLTTANLKIEWKIQDKFVYTICIYTYICGLYNISVKKCNMYTFARIVMSLSYRTPLTRYGNGFTSTIQSAGNCRDGKKGSTQIARFLGPTWVLLSPGGPHVGPMNLAIGAVETCLTPRQIICLFNWQSCGI